MKSVYPIFLVIVLCLAQHALYAQFPYTLSTYTGQTYTPLSSGTSINGTQLWGPNTNYGVPLPFTIMLGNKSVSTFFLEGGIDAVSDTSGLINIADFTLCDAPLVDRGLINGTSALSQSPIRYTVSGTSPNAIFKAEVYNAGFLNEYLDYGTLNDSVNFQIWYYQTSNIIEFHYGPSQITPAYDTAYFYPGGVELGFSPNLDTNFNGTSYILTGNNASPVVDSFTYADTLVGLSPFPPNGTVYRFTPLTSGVKNLSINDLRVYPTLCNDVLFIKNSSIDNTNYQVIAINGTPTSLSGTLQSGTNKLDLGSLTPGVYLIQMQNLSGRSIQKFIKM